MTHYKTIPGVTNVRALSAFAGNTKFDFWKEVEVGDILQVEVTLTFFGTGYPSVTNLRTGKKFSINQHRNLSAYLNFKEPGDGLKQINWEIVRN